MFMFRVAREALEESPELEESKGGGEGVLMVVAGCGHNNN